MEVRETDTKDEFSQVCQTLSLSLSCLCFSSVVFYNDTTESIPIIHRRSHQATLTRRCLFPPCQTWTGIQSLFCSPNPRCLIGASVPSRPRGTVTFTSFFLLFLFVFFFASTKHSARLIRGPHTCNGRGSLMSAHFVTARLPFSSKKRASDVRVCDTSRLLCVARQPQRLHPPPLPHCTDPTVVWIIHSRCRVSG